MSVVPASSLSSADLHILGGNVLVAVRHDRRKVLSAVNRSLQALHQESVPDLFTVRSALAAGTATRRSRKGARGDA